MPESISVPAIAFNGESGTVDNASLIGGAFDIANASLNVFDPRPRSNMLRHRLLEVYSGYDVPWGIRPTELCNLRCVQTHLFLEFQGFFQSQHNIL